MQVSATLLIFAIVFLPGLIWALVDQAFARKREATELQLIVRAFLFGLAAYEITYLIYVLFEVRFDHAAVDTQTGRVDFPAFVDELLAGVAVSILMSVLWLYMHTYKIVVRLLQIMRATKRFGDEDVWEFIFNSRDAAVEYVNFRDFEKRFVCSGYVRAFSETSGLRELLLRDAQVHDFDGNLMYGMPQIYLARGVDNIHIEFPYSPTQSLPRVPETPAEGQP